MVHRITILIAIVGVLWAGIALASNKDLRVNIRAKYPTELITVAQATNYLLEPVGYSFITRGDIAPDARDIGNRQIRATAESNNIIPLEDALLLLAGDDCRLIVDYEHKLVSFEKIKGE
jgi:hypothetical protein